MSATVVANVANDDQKIRRSSRKAAENASNALKELAVKTRPQTNSGPKAKRSKAKDGESKPKPAKKAGTTGKRGRPASKVI